MDGTKFDAMTQELAEAPSRRRLLAGLLGGATALTGALALRDAEAKKGKGKAKGKNKNKGKNNGGNGKGKKHGHNKVAICHQNGDGTFSFKEVPSPALKGHRKHGDIVCGDSEPGVCQTDAATGCDAETGACSFATAADDTPCVIVVDEVETPGTCQAGECVATEPAP